MLHAKACSGNGYAWVKFQLFHFLVVCLSKITAKLNQNNHRTSLVAQTVKSLPTMLETRVRSLGREDPLEKEMATHSSTLA